MILSNISISRQSAVMVLLVITIIAGSYSYVSLSQESAIDITTPCILTETEDEGMSPEDKEKPVTMPIKRKHKRHSGLPAGGNIVISEHTMLEGGIEVILQ